MNLFGSRGILGVLVISDAEESRETEGDTLHRIHDPLAGPVDRRDGQIGALDLPHLDGLEPMIWSQRRVKLQTNHGHLVKRSFEYWRV